MDVSLYPRLDAEADILESASSPSWYENPPGKYQSGLPPPVPHESTSMDDARPALSTTARNTPSALGDLHIFPKQTKSTDVCGVAEHVACVALLVEVVFMLASRPRVRRASRGCALSVVAITRCARDDEKGVDRENQAGSQTPEKSLFPFDWGLTGTFVVRIIWSIGRLESASLFPSALPPSPF